MSVAPGRTLARAIRWDGVGLHCGAQVRAAIEPAPRDVVFVRADLPGHPEVPATVTAALAATEGRHTVLEAGGVRVATVEHVLAVLAAFGVTAARVVLDGPEVPDAGDGSAAFLAGQVAETGVVQAAAAPDALRLQAAFSFEDGHARFHAEPAEQLTVDYLFDHPHPHLGRQRAEFSLSPQAFVSDIAPARTFVTLDEVAWLRENGLAQGGSLENAVVVGPDGPLPPQAWRFPDEAVRHKILDLLGDLALLGRPLCARIRAERTGHRANVRFAAALETAASRPRVD